MLLNKDYDCKLTLQSGEIFVGYAIGHKSQDKFHVGELCFTSAITGYQETITDPSYAGQIVVFSFPYIGNIGTNLEDMESYKAHLQGVIFNLNITQPSNHRNLKDLETFLQQQKIPGICNIDTRELIQIIRRGPQNAIISPINYKIKASDFDCQQDLFTQVIKKEYAQQEISNQRKTVIVIDCGIKDNIIRSLAMKDCNVVVLPFCTTIEEINKYKPDAFLISNGPGDPRDLYPRMKNLLSAIINTKLPILGICLGHQLLSLHYGLNIEKLVQGHRGINHPVLNIANHNLEITTQNHGYVVKGDLPNNIKITYRSLLDNSIEGIKIIDNNQFIESIQFHPENCPGTHDSEYIFDNFCKQF